VPKKSSPPNMFDYRPISVTPVMSRLTEKILVQRLLRPALSMDLLKDQFVFYFIGTFCSIHYIKTNMITTSGLVTFTHHSCVGG